MLSQIRMILQSAGSRRCRRPPGPAATRAKADLRPSSDCGRRSAFPYGLRADAKATTLPGQTFTGMEGGPAQPMQIRLASAIVGSTRLAQNMKMQDSPARLTEEGMDRISSDGSAATDASPPRQASGRWTFHFRSGDHQIQLADGLVLEWKADAQSGTDEPAEAKLVDDAGQSYVEIETSRQTQWIRLVAAIGAAEKTSLLAVQITLQVARDGGSDVATVEPMLALRPTATSQRRDGIASTRSRLTLEAGRWYRIHGLFQAGAIQGPAHHDLLINLPKGRRLRIAGVEIDELGGAGIALPSLPADVVEPVVPFAAEKLDGRADPSQISLGAQVSPNLASIAKVVGASPAKSHEMSAHLLLQAPSPAAMLTAEALLDRLGYTLQLRANTAPNEPARALVSALLGLHADLDVEPEQAQLDTIALQAIADEAAKVGLIEAGNSRPMAVMFTAPPSPADREYWQALAQAGLVDALVSEADIRSVSGQVLEVVPEARFARLAIAFLRTATSAASGGAITAESRKTSMAAWKDMIVGFSDGEAPRATVGRLSVKAGHSDTGRHWQLARVVSPANTALPQQASIDPRNAYAFIVRTDPQIPVDHLINLGNCLIFNSFSELRLILFAGSERILRKPVIPLLLRQLTPAADQIIASVARHWAYGGRYAITSLCCDYGSDTGQVRLTRVARAGLHRVALRASVLSMPVSEALRPDVENELFVPATGLAVCVDAPELGDEQIARIGESYHPDRLPSAVHEGLARAGGLDQSVLRSIDLDLNWPIEPLVSERVLRFEQMILQMQQFVEAPSPSTAEAVLDAISPADADLYRHGDSLDPFLVALSRSPGLLLALAPEQIARFIELTRMSARADQVAPGLALVADRICLLESGLIAPLVDLLASALPPPDLSSTLGFAAARIVDAPERHVVAFADSLQRFAGPATLAMLLVAIHRATPERLANPALRQCFASLVDSGLIATLMTQLGAGPMREIKAAVGPIAAFRAVVETANREAATRISGSLEEMRRVDFLAWMDDLRGLSNELRNLALPVGALALPGIASLPRKRLAAVILSDKAAVSELERSGLLQDRSSLNAAALSVLGRNDMLNDLIAHHFSTSAFVPMRVEGESTAEVFRNAQNRFSGLSASPASGLITVIMTAFDPDIELMKASIDSIRRQTHRNVEIIVVDDASSPASSAAIQGLADGHPRTRLIRLDRNSGPYVGRNIALSQAQGDFIAIQDSDDWSHPQRLEAQLAVFAAQPEAQLTTTSHMRIDRSGRVQLERNFSLFGDGTMTSMFRRSVFDLVGPFAAVRSRGDVEFRERLRSYFGHQAIAAVPLAMVLCLGESRTLSQTVQASKAEHLRLFRTNITRRRTLANLRRDGTPLGPEHRIPIPFALRADMEPDSP